jgi:hypothetical protein
MMQVEVVVKMLDPGFNVCGIAAKRRNKSKPWFKRGTLFRSGPDDGAGDCRHAEQIQGSGDFPILLTFPFARADLGSFLKNDSSLSWSCFL